MSLNHMSVCLSVCQVVVGLSVCESVCPGEPRVSDAAASAVDRTGPDVPHPLHLLHEEGVGHHHLPRGGQAGALEDQLTLTVRVHNRAVKGDQALHATNTGNRS